MSGRIRKTGCFPAGKHPHKETPMFVAFVLYTSANGYENKLYSPGNPEQGNRAAAFPTLEAAQAALTAETTVDPFTDSIQKNGYRSIVLDLGSGQVVSD